MLKIFYLFIFSLASLQVFAQLQVEGHTPTNQSITAERYTEIVFTFNQAIEKSSVTDTTFRVFGRWSGPKTGVFSFEQENTIVRFIPDKDFFAGEWVTVALSNQIAADSGDTLSHGYAFNFWVATAASDLQFEQLARIPIRQEGEDHIQSYGAYAGDLDGDGWSDLAIPNEQTNDVRVFHNDGEGNYEYFEIHPLIDGAKPSANEGTDFNLDGIIDFAVANTDNGNIHVLLGDEIATFQPAVSYKAQQGVRGLSILDFNADGFDDIITANRVGDNLTVFENDKTGRFKAGFEVESGGRGETAIAVTDANNDGILDVFVGAFQSREVILMLGDSLGNWKRSDRQTVAGNPWMLAVGDLNQDGNADVISVNSYGHSASVLFGDGEGKLINAQYYSSGLFPLAVDIGDLDGDGDLDIVSSQYSSADWIIHENDGLGNFNHQDTLVAQQAGSCAILHDRDQDGDLDITAIDELSDEIFIFDHVNPTVHTVSNAAQSLSLNLFPNPATERLMMDATITQADQYQIRIVNALGQGEAIIHASSLNAGKHQFTWNGKLSDGLYFVILESTSLYKSLPFIWRNE